MVMFGLNDQDKDFGDTNARNNPYDPLRDSAPSFYEGGLREIGPGLQESYYRTKATWNRLSPFRDEDEKERNRQEIAGVIKELQPDPQTTGWLGNVSHGLASLLPQLGAAAVAAPAIAAAGVPMAAGAAALTTASIIGTTQGVSTSEILKSEVDKETAEKIGAVEGLVTAAGVFIPGGFGAKLVTKMLSGVGVNIGLGAVQRGYEGQLLRNKGYKDMAEQYRALDGAALITDAVFGAVAGATHAKPDLSQSSKPSVKESGLIKPTEKVGEVRPQEIKQENIIVQPQQTQQPDLETLVHKKAEELSPRRIGEFKELLTKQYEFSNKMRELQVSRDQEINNLVKPHDEEIKILQQKMEDTTPRLAKKYQSRIDELNEKNNVWLEEKKSSVNEEYSKAMQEYQNADYALRDMAPKITAIYKEAEMQVSKSLTKPSDIDMALSANNWRNLELTSAPGIPTDINTRNSHIRAMDQATMQLLAGEEVNVSNLFKDPKFISKELPDRSTEVDQMLRDHGYTEEMIKGSDSFVKEQPIIKSQEETKLPTEKQVREIQDNIDRDIENKVLENNPDLVIPTEEGDISIKDLISKADEELNQAKKDASLFDVAISCFLRNG